MRPHSPWLFPRLARSIPRTARGGFAIALAGLIAAVAIIGESEDTGRLEAVERVELRARVSGYLKSIHFKDGQFVEKGDLLFVIDQRPFENALKAAEARLESARAQLKLSQEELDRGEDRLYG